MAVVLPQRRRVPEPSDVDPSKNSTVPVGVPEPPPLTLTVAVKVTDWPNTDGLAEEVTVVVLLALATVCDRRGGAGGEVGVAAVDGRDRCACRRPALAVVKVRHAGGVERAGARPWCRRRRR